MSMGRLNRISSRDACQMVAILRGRRWAYGRHCGGGSRDRARCRVCGSLRWAALVLKVSITFAFPLYSTARVSEGSPPTKQPVTVSASIEFADFLAVSDST